MPDANITFGGSGVNRTVKVTPAANQSGMAKITVSVSDGADNASNSFVLAVDETTVDTTAPKVNKMVPAENAKGVAPRANISAFFSEAMRAGSIDTNTVKLFKAGTTTPIAAVVGYDASTNKAVVDPNANLKRGAKYKAVVTTGAQDLAGNGLDQDPTLSGNQPKRWFFTVRN